MAFQLLSTKQKALFRLRGKLTWRGYVKEKGKLWGFIIGLIFFLPMIIGLAIATGAGYLFLPDRWPAQVLGGVLVLMWVVWLSFPFLVGNLNEGLDVTRLLVYPISRREIATGVLLGTVFDYPTYIMLPIFIAIFVGWFGWGLPMVIVGVLVAYALMIVSSQLLLTAVGGLLQSRRFRDLSIVFASLFGISCYLLSQACQQIENVVGRFASPEELEAFFVTFEPLLYLRWLPPGGVAQAIVLADAGQWGWSLLWLGYALAWLVLITWVWLNLLERLVTGHGFLVNLAPKEEVEKEEKRSASRASGWLARFPSDIGALMLKEWRSAWRMPQRRVAVIQSFIMPFFFGGFLIFNGDLGSMVSSRFSAAWLLFYAFISFIALTSNMLAWEGRGLATLFLSPVDRRHIFWAKALALMPIAALPILIFGIPLMFLSPGLWTISFFMLSLAIGGITTAVSIPVSVRFPTPINLKNNQPVFKDNRRGGCLAAIVGGIAVPIVISLLSLPLAAPTALALWQDWPLLALLMALVSLPYAGWLVWYAGKYTGEMLLKREPEVLDVMRLSEGE